MWGVRGRALCHPRPLVLWGCGRGPLPTGCGCGGCGPGDPSPTPQRALLQAGFARCGGGTRAPRGGASCLGVGRPGSRALPPPTTRLFGRAAGARFPLAVGAVCGRGGPAVFGTFPRAAVCRVLCALPRFAAPGGRCGLAPVLVLWLWPAACLSGVSPGPALVRNSSSGPVSLDAPVGSSVAVVPSPTPWAVAPGLTGWLRGARGGRPRTGLIVPACWPLPGQGRWARSASYPFGAPQWGCPWRVPPASVLGCVRCGGLACVDPVTDASGFPYRPSGDGGLGRCTGTVSCGRRHRPFRVGGRHARVPRVCVCACPAWPGRVGRPPGRVLVLLTFFFGRSWCALCLFRLLWARVALVVVVVWFFCFCFFFVSFPLLPLVAPPLCPALRVFRPRVPWALASCPPPLLFSLPPLGAPRCLLLCVFSGLRCLQPWRLVAPSPLFFFLPPRLPVVSGASCFPVALGLCAPPPPYFFLFLPWFLVFSFSVFFSSFFFFFPFFFCRLCGAGRICVSWAVGCASVVLSLSLLCVCWPVLCGVGC